jgi:hypothetical protein
MNPTLITIALLALFPPQDRSPFGSIRGTVISESSGEAIVNATIELSRTSNSTHTDKNGSYGLSMIAPGIYNLKFSAPGYVPLVFLELMIPPATPLGISVRLRDSKGEQGKSIAIKLSQGLDPRAGIEDKMLFYRPDSTIDYKIRIVNPDSLSATQGTIKRK